MRVRVDGFFTKVVETGPGFFDDAPDHAQTFWGFYAVRPLKFLSEGNIDLYYLGIDRKRARFDQGTARERRHSIGMRLWGQKSAWDYNSEFVFQLGRFGRGNIQAWAVASDVGYTLNQLRFRPRLGLRPTLQVATVTGLTSTSRPSTHSSRAANTSARQPS